MGPQRTGQQAVTAIGSQHLLLRKGFRMRIVAKPALRIGYRFVHTLLIAAVKGYAGAAGVDQLPHAVPETTGDHVLRRQRIDAVIVLPRPPDPGNPGSVVDDIDAPTSVSRSLGVAQVALNRLDAGSVQLRISLPRNRPHLVAAGEQHFDQIQAEETPGAGDKSFQVALLRSSLVGPRKCL